MSSIDSYTHDDQSVLSQREVAERFNDEFGGAQAIVRLAEGYLRAFDQRKDGQAVGY